MTGSSSAYLLSIKTLSLYVSNVFCIFSFINTYSAVTYKTGYPLYPVPCYPLALKSGYPLTATPSPQPSKTATPPRIHRKPPRIAANHCPLALPLETATP